MKKRVTSMMTVTKKKLFLFDLKAINFDLIFLGWIYFSQ